MVTEALRRFFLYGCILLQASSSYAQGDGSESGVVYIEYFCANRSAIKNYDVSFDQWAGFEERDGKDDDSANAEIRLKGRIVCDWETERIVFVYEKKLFKADEKQEQFGVFTYFDGAMTAELSTAPTFIRRKCTLPQFFQWSGAPAVENTILQFPSPLRKNSREELSKSEIETWSNSTSSRNIDGSVTVTKARKPDDPTLFSVQFDSVSSMPTEASIRTIDLANGNTVRTVLSSTPRFEKCKEVFRLASIAFKNDTFLRLKDGKEVEADSISTCTFNWRAFNEDSIEFPCEEGTRFDLESAREFLEKKYEEE